MDDDSLITDDDRQTPSTGQHSSDEICTEIIAVVAKENALIPDPVETANEKSSIKFNDDSKQFIFDKHVKISRVNRASLHSLNTELRFSQLSALSRRKSTGTVCVSHGNKAQSQMTTDNSADQSTRRQTPVRNIPTRTTEHKVLDSTQKMSNSKTAITRVSFSELPFGMGQKDEHVTVKHISIK
ncbi:unnamed protein product [Adineta ricciae]|uniref:Uncharacterized protein n=1 Tax=Adineta ricciae TaxID=249248 RepID=A0A815CXU4_ADIRI|nr:unnamed protein product [Adineta ricciae]CAF1293833.1 unnamed protein product [Adineta ricciae]